MEKITVLQKEERADAFVFEVHVGDGRPGSAGTTVYRTVVPKEYAASLTRGRFSPEELVQKSFIFLLAREPMEAILKTFELPVIGHYFPEYEREMKK